MNFTKKSLKFIKKYSSQIALSTLALLLTFNANLIGGLVKLLVDVSPNCSIFFSHHEPKLPDSLLKKQLNYKK